MAKNKDEKIIRSYLLQSFHKQNHFFSRLYEEHFEKIQKKNKLGNPNKITRTFASPSKYGLTSTTITLISTKLALTVVPKTAVVGAVLQLLQSQLLELQLVFQEQNLSIFTVQQLRERYQKSSEGKVIDQTESSKNRWTIGCSDGRY